MYRITLTVGDWSKDGHEKTEVYMFDSSHSAADIQAAYSNGLTKEQHSLIEDIASDYEDSSLSEEQLQILVDIGYAVNDMQWDSDNEDNEPYITEEEFVDLYWFIVQRGNPEITYTAIEADDIHIGGYGFFY